MTRVLFVSTSSTLGGAEKTLRTLAGSLDAGRYRTVAVISLKPKGEIARRLEADGIAVHSLDLRGLPSLRHLRKLRELIEQLKPDLVHAFMYQAIQLCRAAKRLGGAFRLISSPRVHYRSRGLPSLWLDDLLKEADDLLIAESESSRRYLVERRRYDADRVLTIRNGIDASRWTPSPADRERIRSRLGVSDGECLLGSVGRLDGQKGHWLLLEALAQLAVAHPVKAVIVGEGPLRGKLESLARHLKLEGRVIFSGEQADLGPWLSAMDLFALPSLWEGLPNALLEAMAMGLPAAASRVDGVEEVIAHGENGLLFAPDSVRSLYDALQELIVDVPRRQRLAAAGRQTVVSRFSLSAMLERYHKAYARLSA